MKCCIALASLDFSVLEHRECLVDMSVEQRRQTHRVNVEKTFSTARMFLRQLRDSLSKASNEQKNSAANKMENVSLIILALRVVCLWGVEMLLMRLGRALSRVAR
jgi:hypothetical protein